MTCRQQTFYPTDYYLSKPVSNDERRLYFMTIRCSEHIGPIFPPSKCLFYAPMFVDGNCRVCFKNPEQHQKYYIYSILASKIQRAFFKFQFKKIIKDNYKLLNKSFTFYPICAVIIKYKYRYYRNWNRYTLEQYLKKIDL
jgi:hypothetical protein